MRILITGNMGYVGPVVVEHLRSIWPTAELIGYDTGYFGACLTASERLPEARLDRQIFADVRDFDPQLAIGLDAIVHLAAISNDPIGNLYEQVTYDINHVATVRIAEAAKAANVPHFVFASSCSIYGFAEDGPRSESSQLGPLTPYAKSKMLAERDLQPLVDERFRVTCLRFPTACGMSARLRLDLVLNDFVACAQSGKEIRVLSDGTPWRPLIDVHDMAVGIEWALSRSGQGGYLVINVGRDDRNTQIRDLAHAVARHYAGATVSINDQAPPDKRSYRVTFDLYREMAPKHQPRVALDQSIEALRDGMGKMGFSDQNFAQSNWIRLNYLTMLRRIGQLDAEMRWTHAAAR
jgi:nucleoside-diphosphate-sugar epimerase